MHAQHVEPVNGQGRPKYPRASGSPAATGLVFHAFGDDAHAQRAWASLDDRGDTGAGGSSGAVVPG